MHFLQSALETLLNSLGSKGSKGSSKRPCEHTGLAGADPAAASLEALLDGAEPSALDTLFDQQPSTTKRRKIAAQLEVPAASSALEVSVRRARRQGAPPAEGQPAAASAQPSRLTLNRPSLNRPRPQPLHQMQRALRDAVGSWSSSSSQLESFCASSSEGESGSESSPGLCACLLAGGSSDLRGAFFANLQSTTALAALVATEQLHSDAQRKATLQRPFCHDSPSDNLKATLGAMYCLLRRGKWGAHELTPELLVTALWLVQAWDEQLWQFASYSAQAFAKRDPAAKGEHAPLHRAMLVLQLEVSRAGRLCACSHMAGSCTRAGGLLTQRCRPAGPDSVRLALPPAGLRAALGHPGAERVP